MRPEITISDKQIVVITPTYRLHIEFPAYIDPAAVAAWGRGFESAKQVIVNNEIAESTGQKTKAKTGVKICKICGTEYKPTSNAQQYCNNCKPVKYKNLDEMNDNELDKTMAEIKQRRKQTYTID